jgi:putative endonuclease
MQEVGGSIPPGSTTLRPSGYAWRSHARAEGRSVPGIARRARTGWNGHVVRLHNLICSVEFPEQEYTGATADLKRRISDHNAGKSTHTAKFKPWEQSGIALFPDKHKALEFEKYLKSHCGRGFAKKRL